MNFDDLKYDLSKNKSKIMLTGAIVVFIISAFLVLKFFGVELKYDSGSDGSVSTKYVLATTIIGSNKNGDMNLYDSKTGEVVATNKLEGGNFIYSATSNMKKVMAYSKDAKTLYEIEPKTKKISVKQVKNFDIGKNKIVNFKYKNGVFVGLLEGERKLLCVDIKKSKRITIDLKLNSPINNYEITDKNIVFTSGDYIGTARIADGKGSKIDIGALSLSIHLTKNKLFVHNSFGLDRNKSILLDINPETLHINKAYQFKESRVNMMQTSSESELLYYSEEFLTSTQGNVKQVFKTIGEDMKNPAAIMKYISKDSMDRLNSYGYLGYCYYRNLDTLEIFNLRSLETESVLKVHEDFYMPVY